MKIPCTIFLLLAFPGLWATPQCVAEETFQNLLISEAWKESTEDLTIKTTMRTEGGSEREQSGESTIFLKRGEAPMVLFHAQINGEPGKLRLTDTERVTWSDDDSSRGGKPFQSAEEGWGYLCTMHMREFLLIPSEGNTAFLDKNFDITQVDREEGESITLEFELKAEPTDRILKIFASQEAVLGGVLEIDPETRFVSSFVLDFVRGEHKRRHEVSATYEVGELEEEIFEIPEQLRERIHEMLSKAREQAGAE